MKIDQMKVLAFVVVALVLSAGSCDRTDIRHRGIINVDSDTMHTGDTFTLTLVVPEALEGSVYKAIWSSEPEEGLSFEYEENTLIGDEVIKFNKDRQAVLTPVKAGDYRIKVFIFHAKQTSPQLFAEREIRILEKK
ncbi:hypothetical protein KAU32_01385 [bacterium]|nr:hypothetical protein [bacterium]